MDAIEEDVATKSDLNEVKYELKTEIATAQLEIFETNVVFKLGRIIVICFTLGLAALGLVLKFH